MSDLRPKHATIELGGKTYGLLFNINAMDAIQDRFDIPFSEIETLLNDERKAYKALKGITAILINEAIDDSESGEPHVTEAFVGRKITPNDILRLRVGINSALIGGMPESDVDEDDEDPNGTSGQ